MNNNYISFIVFLLITWFKFIFVKLRNPLTHIPVLTQTPLLHISSVTLTHILSHSYPYLRFHPYPDSQISYPHRDSQFPYVYTDPRYRAAIVESKNESFEQLLSDVSLEFLVSDWDRVTKNEVVGRLKLGAGAADQVAIQHWRELLQSPRKQLAEWHALTEWL